MSYKVLANIDSKIAMIPGDVIIVSSVLGHKRHEHVRHVMSKVIDCSTVAVVEFENEFNMASGVAGVFGT